MGSTLSTLKQLKALGVRIALDDFCTGYSSLATLKPCPLNTVKIHRSLVRDYAGAGRQSVADAIIALGKIFELTVVAQGVETKEQAEYLRAHACDELQEFYFTKPLSADEFAKLLRGESIDRSIAEVEGYFHRAEDHLVTTIHADVIDRATAVLPLGTKCCSIEPASGSQS